MAEATLESKLTETRHFPPPAGFVPQATFRDDTALSAARAAALADPEAFWGEVARRLIAWQHPFDTVLDASRAPQYAWFLEGRLNASYNCLDRHLPDRADKRALIFEPESGPCREITYGDLHGRVCRFANALRAQGVTKGDRVVIYLPMVPEAVVAMQACARIGALHSVVFGGFSAEALRDRIEDAGARLLITADGGHRNGKIIPLKAAADKALSRGCSSIERVIVLRWADADIHMEPGRDLWWHELTETCSTDCEPEWVEAEHPLFLLYTSGSTGKPKGIQHATGGYLVGATATAQWVFDLSDDDVFWCTADVGWITGHSYIAYGPLALGVTQVIYEGGPMYPEGDRFWSICARHGVTVFYTAPTAIRALMRLGDHLPARHDLSRLRLLGTVGEPINPEAWMWYHRVIGGERCPIVDTWWQTETGAIMISPIPSVTVLTPGSCTTPLPGIDAAVVDGDGREVTEPDRGGMLVIRRPWPSMVRTLWRDPERFRETYFGAFGPGIYVTGDSARRDERGNFWIMGRLDDVLNVSGHRLGTMEIESALVAHPDVVEAAVVGRPDELTGEAVVAFVVPARGVEGGEDLTRRLRQWVAEQIGPIARPADLWETEALPKTRSGKIMRRLLRAIAAGEPLTQDISTLENEVVVTRLVELVRATRA